MKVHLYERVCVLVRGRARATSLWSHSLSTVLLIYVLFRWPHITNWTCKQAVLFLLSVEVWRRVSRALPLRYSACNPPKNIYYLVLRSPKTGYEPVSFGLWDKSSHDHILRLPTSVSCCSLNAAAILGNAELVPYIRPDCICYSLCNLVATTWSFKTYG